MTEHETKPILVWADVDIGVLPIVWDLNRIEGVRTLASCEATGRSYAPYVMAAWPSEKLAIILKRYDVTLLGNNWGHIHPRPE